MTKDEAYRAAMATFKTAWDTVGHPVAYPNVPLSAATQARINGGALSWARVTYKPNTRMQQSLAGVGGRIFEQTGVMSVEIFTPSGDGGALERTLSDLVEHAFEGISTPNGLWFRNVRTLFDGPDGPWSRATTRIEFLYQEVR